MTEVKIEIRAEILEKIHVALQDMRDNSIKLRDSCEQTYSRMSFKEKKALRAMYESEVKEIDYLAQYLGEVHSCGKRG